MWSSLMTTGVLYGPNTGAGPGRGGATGVPESAKMIGEVSGRVGVDNTGNWAADFTGDNTGGNWTG